MKCYGRRQIQNGVRRPQTVGRTSLGINESPSGDYGVMAVVEWPERDRAASLVGLSPFIFDFVILGKTSGMCLLPRQNVNGNEAARSGSVSIPAASPGTVQGATQQSSVTGT